MTFYNHFGRFLTSPLVAMILKYVRATQFMDKLQAKLPELTYSVMRVKHYNLPVHAEETATINSKRFKKAKSIFTVKTTPRRTQSNLSGKQQMLTLKTVNMEMANQEPS